MYYTLGQRGGIGLGGMKGASEGAWFVLHKDLENNRLVVGQGHEHPLMQSTALWVKILIGWRVNRKFLLQVSDVLQKLATVSQIKRVQFTVMNTTKTV